VYISTGVIQHTTVCKQDGDVTLLQHCRPPTWRPFWRR